MLSVKDLVSINQEFHRGEIINQGSLSFALDQAKRTKDWLKASAYLARAVLLDHVFADGNKRTAAAVIITFIDMQNLNFNKEKVNQAVVEIVKKNVKDIKKITRLIKNVLQ